MKLSFENRIKDTETKYLEKYSKKIAYQKIHKKYSNYLEKANHYLSSIVAFSIHFLVIYFIVYITSMKFNIYVVLSLSFVGIVIISYVISLALYHFKNKEVVLKKLNEWENKIEDITGDENDEEN